MTMSSATAFYVGRDALSPVHAIALAQSTSPSSEAPTSPSPTLSTAPTPSGDISSVGRTPPSPQLATALTQTQSSTSIYDDLFRAAAIYTITINEKDPITGSPTVEWFDRSKLLSTNKSVNPAFRTGSFLVRVLDNEDSESAKTWHPGDELYLDPKDYQLNDTIDNWEYDGDSFVFSGYTVKVFNPKANPSPTNPSIREMPVVAVLSSDYGPFESSPYLLFSQIPLTNTSFPKDTQVTISGVTSAYMPNTVDSFILPPATW